MTSIQLRQVIFPGARLAESYDTLFVLEWDEYPWRKQDFNGLVCICHRLKIRRVIFTRPSKGDISAFCLNNVLKWYNEVGCPFLPHLKVIQTQANSHHPALTTLVKHSRIKELSWYLEGYEAKSHSLLIDQIFYYADPRLLRCNRSIQRIRFFSDAANPGKHRYDPIQVDEVAGNLQLSECALRAFKDCTLWMQNNAAGWKNCVKSILILLGLKKKETKSGHSLFSCLSRDTLGIVISMVWETRGTKVWTE
jgi:hypothetical protein